MPERLLTPTDDPPWFDVAHYERDCSQPTCEARIVFHWAEISTPPRGDGQIIHIVAKCLGEGCGKVDRFNPAITETDADYLRDQWDGERFFLWTGDPASHATELRDGVLSDSERKTVQQRLTELGYF